MHLFTPYSDLRQNQKNDSGEDSIWPTFTDIMTVILMIFMFTMITVILKSSDLATQLKQSNDSGAVLQGKLATAQAKERESLGIIASLEDDLSSKEMEIILLGEENRLMKSSLDAKVAVISMLEGNLVLEKEERAKNMAQVQSLEQSFALLQKEKDDEITRLVTSQQEKLNTINAETEKKIEEFNEKFAALTALLSKKEQTILIARSAQENLQLDLARQRSEFSSLEEKYNKLIRPARSTEGKIVVTVRYMKENGKARYFLKDVDARSYVAVSRKEMGRKLESLKKRHGNDLYVKVNIPEKSNLSYNDAWTFTNEILSRYDYYHQQ